jgi:hypothetical protein
MGTNEAVELANIYLDHHTDSRVRDNANLLLYKRFIDDIIGVWTGSKGTNSLQRISNFRSNILKWSSARSRGSNFAAVFQS